MNSLKPIALQLYTVREAMAQDWMGVLERIAEMGYVGVETAGFGYASPSEAKEAFDRFGLEVIGSHAPLPLGDSAESLIETMNIIGSQRIICAGTGRDEFNSVDAIKARAEQFNLANAAAKAAGMSFGLHNHWWEFAVVDGEIAMDLLINDMDNDVFFEIDTYWVQTAGQDAVNTVARFDHRTPLLHIKDGPLTQAGNMVAVGEGKMNIPGVIKAGPSAEWLVVELDRCGTDMMKAVEDSINYLTSNSLGRGR